MPLISIIIPTYNHSKLLPRAIESVLKQKFKDWELIIVDDGSKDNTKEIINKYKDIRIKYHYQKNSGVASAMNTGFDMATGNFFAWLDADNYYDSNILSKIEEYTINNPQTDIFYGNVVVFNTNGPIKTFVPKKKINYREVLLHTSGSVPVQPGVFFKRHLYKQSGGFNSKYRIAGDIDFWVKVLKLKPSCLYVNKVFGYYLQDDKGISQGLKGISSGLKEMRDIFINHKQPLLGRFLMEKKYYTSYIKMVIKSLIKKLK